jgi:hypothetical protein
LVFSSSSSLFTITLSCNGLIFIFHISFLVPFLGGADKLE